jgi:hypothetical protein
MIADGRHRTCCRHHPRKRMIQYAAAFVFDLWRHGILDRPVKPGDDSGGLDVVS